jgi:dolichol-phosphate mannosyltransferase
MTAPAWLDTQLFGNAISHWLIAIGSALLAATVVALLRGTVVRRLEVVAAKTDTAADDYVVALLRAIRPWLVIAVTLAIAEDFLDLPGRVDKVAHWVIVGAMVLQALRWINSSVDFWVDEFARREGGSAQKSALSVFAMGARLILWTLVILVAVHSITNAPLTTIVASLGVGGVAIALAVQNILGDLFGALAIALDKPFLVGDAVAVDAFEGTIEHIGLKTTRIQRGPAAEPHPEPHPPRRAADGVHAQPRPGDAGGATGAGAGDHRRCTGTRAASHVAADTPRRDGAARVRRGDRLPGPPPRVQPRLRRAAGHPAGRLCAPRNRGDRDRPPHRLCRPPDAPCRLTVREGLRDDRIPEGHAHPIRAMSPAPAPRSGEVTLTVIVPCFNEEAVIAQTHARLRAAVRGIPHVRAELLYVDDGSHDRTLDILRGLAADDPTVRVLSFSRNFGHQLALTAGLEHASGDAVAVIDADLQDPPEVLGAFVERWRAGVDVAYGVRRHREGETGFKLFTAHLFYRLMKQLSEADIPYDAGDFRLMDRAVVNALLAMPERDRFVRGMVSWVGFKQEAVPYDRAARAAGETKYPLRKMIRFALDGIFSFSAKPLRMATYLGFFATGLAVIGVVYAFALRLSTASVVPGWATLLIAVLFLGGVQLVSLGIMGEYVARIYGQVKGRPLYLLRERVGFDGDAPTAR